MNDRRGEDSKEEEREEEDEEEVKGRKERNEIDRRETEIEIERDIAIDRNFLFRNEMVDRENDIVSCHDVMKKGSFYLSLLAILYLVLLLLLSLSSPSTLMDEIMERRNMESERTDIATEIDL